LTADDAHHHRHVRIRTARYREAGIQKEVADHALVQAGAGRFRFMYQRREVSKVAFSRRKPPGDMRSVSSRSETALIRGDRSVDLTSRN
jgi:hypothetical protein